MLGKVCRFSSLFNHFLRGSHNPSISEYLTEKKKQKTKKTYLQQFHFLVFSCFSGRYCFNISPQLLALFSSQHMLTSRAFLIGLLLGGPFHMDWNLLPADMLLIKPLCCHFTERCSDATLKKHWDMLARLGRETETIRSIFFLILGQRCTTNRMLFDQLRSWIHWLHWRTFQVVSCATCLWNISKKHGTKPSEDPTEFQ